MKLSSEPRFQAYVQDQVATARDWLPPGETTDNSTLRFVLLGTAGISIAFTFLSGGSSWMSAESLGAMGLVALASLCWILD